MESPLLGSGLAGLSRVLHGQCFTEPDSETCIRHFVEIGLKTTHGIVTATIAALGLDAVAARNVASAIGCPVLVIHGDADAIAPLEKGVELARLTHGDLHVLPGAGHEPELREAEQTNQLIDDFLNSTNRRVTARAEDRCSLRVHIFASGEIELRLHRIVPRFTALALVSVALIGLTGIYSAWVETGDLTPLATPYATALGIKVTIFLAALLLGALNFADGGRGKGWIGGFGPRVALESLLGIAVVIAAANLVSGSPPGAQRPIAIAAAPSSLHAAIALAFEIQPGRPGPNRYWVVVPARSATGTVVELRLQRLDRDIGLSRIALQPVAGTGVAGGDSGSQVRFAVDGGLLSADSRWDATVVVREADGSERGRERFTFALDAAGIREDRAVPRLDPTILVALALLALAIVGSAFVLGGGRVPRANPTVGRTAVLVSGMIGGALGLLLLLGGTPR